MVCGRMTAPRIQNMCVDMSLVHSLNWPNMSEKFGLSTSQMGIRSGRLTEYPYRQSQGDRFTLLAFENSIDQAERGCRRALREQQPWSLTTTLMVTATETMRLASRTFR